MLTVWLCFLLGAIIYAYIKGVVTASSPLNGYTSREHYFILNAPIIMARLIAGSMLFWAAILSPKLLSHVIPGFLNESGIMLSPPIAWFVGFGVDSAIDKVFALFGWQKIVPIPGMSITKEEKKTTTTEEVTTEKTTVTVPTPPVEKTDV